MTEEGIDAARTKDSAEDVFRDVDLAVTHVVPEIVRELTNAKLLHIIPHLQPDTNSFAEFIFT